jgi:hypothetical protein
MGDDFGSNMPKAGQTPQKREFIPCTYHGKNLIEIHKIINFDATRIKSNTAAVYKSS